jgi:hypothetical protein
MQRSKQQALMFLLGALLVGGVLGASGVSYFSHERFAAQYGPRARFYDEMGLSAQQRATLDSLSFEQDCVIKTVLAPQQARLDSIRGRFKAQWRAVFNEEQLAKYDARRKEIQTRREAEQQKEPKRTCSGN